MIKNKLSIYLIKSDITLPDDIFKDELDVLQEYSQDKIAYYLPSYIKQPDWLENFFNLDQARLKQANSRVILLVRRPYGIDYRMFAITFGYAKNLFKEGVLEEQFGLKILLNSVDENELKKISKINIGGNQKQSQEQIPKSGKIVDFGFDVDRDLVRSITAKTHLQDFANATITGGDIFSLAISKNIQNIEEFLDICYQKFNEDSYKGKFDWIDNIKALRDKFICNELDNCLIEFINNKQFNNVWMSVPEVVQWEQIKCFKYSGDRGEHDDINIEQIIQTIREFPLSTIEQLKNKQIRAISSVDDSIIYSWSSYKCIIAEIDYNHNSYCLNNGKWYKIDNDFANKVKNDYLQIEISDSEYIDYDGQGREIYNEDIYNEDLANYINSALIHKVGEIPYGGGRGNKIEVCDILTSNKELLHIKKNAGSSHLSHLFNQDAFDVVIFDEASQITVWDAIGALSRGSQVIVAGDPKQMPPSNFFGRSVEYNEEESGVEEDLESILDELIGSGVPTLRLNWHYRSRCESLIAFSNDRYYDGSLVTFPAVSTEQKAVSLVKVTDGIYARGARTNEKEAKTLVQECVRRLKHSDPLIRNKSIGIVTFNSDQQKLIEDLLDEERNKYPELEPSFNTDNPNAVFVKNLETVQGDERDIILFSVTYGPDISGKVSMNFGPLNRSGGERRLNVAFTRAKHEMVIFSSLQADQIDLNRTKAQGVADLKYFLQYAKQGKSALGTFVTRSLGGVESPFEQEVANAMRQKGWAVHTQIGASSYRIDLAIVHPDKPGSYLAGIECDGATYHRSATARDRDKLRQAVLENLGWNILRVWSTDWWTNKKGSIEELHSALTALLES